MPTFSDTFNRPDGNNVDSGWNNPGAVFPNYDILLSTLRVRGGAGAIVLVWDTIAPALNSNQFSRANVSVAGNGSRAGLVIRSSVPSGGRGSGYFLRRTNAGQDPQTGWILEKIGTVGTTTLATVGDVVLAGDQLQLQNVGLLITALRNGAMLMQATDPQGGEGPVPAGGRVGFVDITGQPLDLWQWAPWTGGWADLAGAKIMRLRR